MLKKKGFTLIELVVVMAIIAILSLLIIAAIQAARSASVESQNRGNARTIEVAMEAYAAKNNGSYPVVTPLDGANNTFSAIIADELSGYVNGWDAGSCTNGGGIISASSASSFTLTIYESNCNDANPTILDTITH